MLWYGLHRVDERGADGVGRPLERSCKSIGAISIRNLAGYICGDPRINVGYHISGITECVRIV